MSQQKFFNKESDFYPVSSLLVNADLNDIDQVDCIPSDELIIPGRNLLNVNPSADNLVPNSGRSQIAPFVTYQCEFCYFEFSSRMDLSQHVETDHNYARPKCYQCDFSFTSYDDLAAHVQACHYSFPVFHCTFCDLYFPSTILLSDHTRTFHQQSESVVNVNEHSEDHHYYEVIVACYFCEICFTDTNDLDLHLQQYHPESVTRAPGQFPEPYNREEICYDDSLNLVYPYPTCESCKIAFPFHGKLEKHVQLEHSEQTVTIPQIDGLDQEMYEFSDVPPTFRTASYSLNQSKQIEKIRADAALNDYEVTVNNNDQNVTIKCSSGFYIQVAKASFVSIKKGSTFSTDKIGITADEVIFTNDQAGLEATKLVHFSFKSEQGGVVLGGVAVHLHHSSRTIQIQGSHIMPDSSRAATWFLNRVTIKRFKDIAKSKKFAVKLFNEAAKSIGKPGATSFPGSNSNHAS